jgi:hypothetical protein
MLDTQKKNYIFKYILVFIYTKYIVVLLSEKNVVVLTSFVEKNKSN